MNLRIIDVNISSPVPSKNVYSAGILYTRLSRQEIIQEGPPWSMDYNLDWKSSADWQAATLGGKFHCSAILRCEDCV